MNTLDRILRNAFDDYINIRNFQSEKLLEFNKKHYAKYIKYPITLSTQEMLYEAGLIR
jgi:hypothetical protein